MPTISLFQLFPFLEKGKASSSVVGDGGRNSKNFVMGTSSQEKDIFEITLYTLFLIHDQHEQNTTEIKECEWLCMNE